VRAFTFEALPGRVVFGAGSRSGIVEEVERLGGTRVLIVTDPATKPVADELGEELGERLGAVFSDVALHVPIEGVAAARDAARRAAADAVVTVGGGTTTGYGKIIALESGNPTLAVPTTYAGSEMTPIYGVTSDGLKRTGRDLRVLPRTVIYDPELTVSLPPAVTAASGMNALAHCVEGLYAKDANPISSLMAEEGIRALAAGIPGAVSRPGDLEARSEAMFGAYLAGATLAVVGMALHHRICHVLGGTFGLAHGDANAVILPHVAAFNRPAAPAELARAARALGAGDAAEALFDFAGAIGAPTSLCGLGFDSGNLDEAARLVFETPLWNPRPADVSDVRALLEDAFHGRRPPER
jgi:maleylacetate reductase